MKSKLIAITVIIAIFTIIQYKGIFAIAFITALICGIIAGILGNKKVKGYLGELSVKLKIGKDIENTQYSIHNYCVWVENKSMQIDHIVINENGIYVIETKNYTGEIYGSDQDLYWTQKTKTRNPKNRKTYINKYEFYNPVKQNETHIINIQKILNKAEIPISNVVVFIEHNTEQVISNCVINISYLNKKLKYQIGNKKLTQAEINDIYIKLREYQEKNYISNKEHKKNVKNSMSIK